MPNTFTTHESQIYSQCFYHMLQFKSINWFPCDGNMKKKNPISFPMISGEQKFINSLKFA